MKLMLAFLLFGFPILSNLDSAECLSEQNIALYEEDTEGEDVCRSFLEQFFTVSYSDAFDRTEQLQNEMQKDIEQADYSDEGVQVVDKQLDTIEAIMEQECFENFTESAKVNFTNNRIITKLYDYVLEKEHDFSVQTVELESFFSDAEHQGYNYDAAVLIGDELTNFTGRIQTEKEMECWKISRFEMNGII